MSAPKQPKPCKAWALVDETGYLYAATCDWSRGMTERHIGGRTWLRAIQVQIRPVTKRRKKSPSHATRTGKSKKGKR